MSIQEIMQTKKTRALDDIRAQFWTDNPNEEEISDIALAAGLEPEQVAEMQDTIERAKSKLQQVAKVDLSSLKSELADARKKLAAVDKKLSKAQDSRTEAAQEVDRINGILATAESELTATARLLAEVDAPEQMIPAVVKTLQGVATATAELSAAEQHERVVKNNLRALDDQVAVLDVRLNAMTARDRQAGEKAHTVLNGRLVPSSEPLAGQVERAKAEAKKGAAAYDAAQERTAKARDALEAAKAAQVA